MRPPGCFNPRLRTGGDQPCGTFGLYCGMFQSTPPHGRRLEAVVPVNPKTAVSIHASAREATRTGSLSAKDTAFQSTPPHGRRPRTGRRCVSGWICVSIHASAREATLAEDGILGPLTSFNPRLRTGGDVFAMHRRHGLDPFQSTPPHGRRRIEPDHRRGGTFVSIHASAREATTRRARN